MTALDNLTLRRLAIFVDGLDRRLAALESRLTEHPAQLGRQIVNRGRWWYVLSEAGEPLNNSGFATREEAERLLARTKAAAA